MKLLILYIILIIPINIGVMWYMGDSRSEMLLVMMIPILLEVLRYGLIKYKTKQYSISVLNSLIVEVVKFALIVVALFVFVSPLKSENMYTSLGFCANFFVAQFVGIYVMGHK